MVEIHLATLGEIIDSNPISPKAYFTKLYFTKSISAYLYF